MRSTAFEAAAVARGVEPAALAIAWVLGHPQVTAVVVGPRRPEHLDPALAALELRLSADRARRAGGAVRVIPLEEIRRAREVLAGKVVRTPLVRLDGTDVYLKLENLQPIGSFKLRGALNAVGGASPEQLRAGVVTGSAGNMGQGVAWAARELGVTCTVVVPENAPEAKLAAIVRLGGRIVKVPYERWWQTLEESSYPELDGLFVHPVQDERVMAGNGTIGLELLEDLPEPDVVLVPIRRRRSQLRYRERRQGAAAGDACLRGRAGDRRAADRRVRGGRAAADRLRALVRGRSGRAGAPAGDVAARTRACSTAPSRVSLDETAEAVRVLARRARVVAEGAGALALAAALGGRVEGGTVVCIVSGGNIDAAKLATILSGGTP